MWYQLIVDHYGKIEHAKVTVAPLTLFVGDNNSGKSYLLSLIWALNGAAYVVFDVRAIVGNSLL